MGWKLKKRSKWNKKNCSWSKIEMNSKWNYNPTKDEEEECRGVNDDYAGFLTQDPIMVRNYG